MRYNHGTHEHYTFNDDSICAVCGATFPTPAPVKLRWQGPSNAPAVLVPRISPWKIHKAVDYDNFCLDSHGGYGACVRVTGHTGAHRDQLGFGWNRPLASRMVPVQVAPVFVPSEPPVEFARVPVSPAVACNCAAPEDWETVEHAHDCAAFVAPVESAPLMFDAAHVDTLQAILSPKDSLITRAQAVDLLNVPSGTRPRMHGLMFEGDRYQIVKLTHVSGLDRMPIVAQWLSGTTYADLISRA